MRQYIGTFGYYANGSRIRFNIPGESNKVKSQKTEYKPLYLKSDNTITITMLSIDGIIYYFNDNILVFCYDFRLDPEYLADDETFRFRIYVNIHNQNHGFVTLYPNSLDDLNFDLDSNNNLTKVTDTTNDTNGTDLTFDMSEFSDIVSNNSLPFGFFAIPVFPNKFTDTTNGYQHKQN